jgi:hypothetical protein
VCLTSAILPEPTATILVSASSRDQLHTPEPICTSLSRPKGRRLPDGSHIGHSELSRAEAAVKFVRWIHPLRRGVRGLEIKAGCSERVAVRDEAWKALWHM